MHKKLPIFYSALLLTLVNLLLRFVGTGFQVYLSRRIGAAGVGLLQLVMSVGGLAMVAGMAGIRTAAMYLTAEELGKHRPENTRHVLSGCFLYSILCSSIAAGILFLFAPMIAGNWIGDIRTLPSLRLLAACIPVTCLCGVMTGYFTAANRIGTLAAVEVAEQILSMAVTLATLTVWAEKDAGRACFCVVLGSSSGAVLTLLCLVFLRIRENFANTAPIPVCSRLMQAALPLAMGDVLKSGINTTENLMVPKRLAACILFALAELLIPELARCNAAESRSRITYLVRRSLKIAVLYGFLFSGLMILLADPLCQQLYGSTETARYLRLYGLLIPMLYCDAMTDAMTKGLGQQKICVRYNILTSAMDVALLFLLLPKYGMDGHFASFLISHLLNFILSLRRLLKISGETIPFYIPALTVSAAAAALWGASQMRGIAGQGLAYIALLGSLLYLFRVIGTEDFRWLRGLLIAKK